MLCLNKRDGKMFCDNCAARPITTNDGKSRVAAIVLALLLGGFGVHKFYLGRIGQGIVYVLFCWTFIPSVVALIEGIIYLTWSDQQFAEKYNT
jgi:TM2 domain-containing membrane protein YozV